MPIVHQEKGFDFTIKAEDRKPPKVHVTGKGGKYLLVRIGKPEQVLPHIDKYENVDQDEVNWVWDRINDYQEKFLNLWNKIHSGEWTPPQSPRKKAEKPATELRLRLKPGAKKDRIKETLGGIFDKRFLALQKKLIWDLDKANFKTIDLVLYLRLGGWSHTGGTYSNTMGDVKVLCEVMFGYVLPEKIGKYFMKKYRYSSGEGLGKLWPVVRQYHESRLKAGSARK